MEAPCVTRPNGPNCGLIWPRHPPQGWEHSSLLWQSLTSASTITLLKIYCAVHERWQRKFSPQHSKVCFAIHLPFIVYLKKLKSLKAKKNKTMWLLVPWMTQTMYICWLIIQDAFSWANCDRHKQTVLLSTNRMITCAKHANLIHQEIRLKTDLCQM